MAPSASARQVRSGRVLVSLQLALSLPLLVGAGLLARTAYNVNRVDLGFASDRLLLARVDFRASDRDDARRNALRADVLDRLQRIPGVTNASYSQLGIFTGGFSSRTIEVEGYARKGDDDRETGVDIVGPRYFATLGAPIVLGRDLAESDRADSPSVCVINETFARKFFDQRNPVGMRITSVDDQRSTSYLVVGVARDVRTQDVRGAVEPRFFVPAAQEPGAAGYPTFLIRSSLPSAAIASQVRQAIGDVDGDLPIASMRTVAERMAPLTGSGPRDRSTRDGLRHRRARARGVRSLRCPGCTAYRGGAARSRSGSRWCATRPRHRDDPSRNGWSDCRGRGARRRARVRRFPLDREPALRCGAAGPGDFCRGNDCAAAGRCERRIPAGAASLEAGTPSPPCAATDRIRQGFGWQLPSVHTGTVLMTRSAVRSRTTGAHAPRSHTRDENAVEPACDSTSYLCPASM